MKKLRQIHLYPGCIFAPVLIFFAVTGAWQLFDLHRQLKDGSYTPREPRPSFPGSIRELREFPRIEFLDSRQFA